MPFKMSMCFTNSNQVNANIQKNANANATIQKNANINISNLLFFNNTSYMNLDQLKRSRGCSSCSGK